MGVKNLWDILEPCKKILPLHHLQNKRLCVDLSCWIIQLDSVVRSPAVLKKKMFLRGLFHRLRALIALNCSLIFVADGAIPSLKILTYRRRLGSKVEDRANEGSQSLLPLNRNMGSNFSRMIKEAKALGLALGIPCLDGMEEAEAQCALLNSASICDGCFSSDSDIFLFGARTVYRDIILGDGGHVVCYEMKDIEEKLGYGRNSMIALAFLLGSDYTRGVRGFGVEMACHAIKSVDNDSILHQISSEGLAIIRKIKGKKKAKEVTLESNVDKENNICGMKDYLQDLELRNQFMQINDAYLNPKCHPVESDALRRVCIPYPFLRSEIQEMCEKNFGWTLEQTDQYILPKFAERDLRRFANLRLTSSELGVNIPMEKLPVVCPVSAVLKRRSLQGDQCFEVSWQGIDGLQTSVISADLLESACPEKISEFLEKEESKKHKRKPRQARPTKADVSKVDEQFQALLLNIDSQSGPVSDLSSFSQTSFSVPTTSQVVDLSSPSPSSLRTRKIPRCRNASENIIDLTVMDSEPEGSPEHVTKARELRLFLDSIRKDLY